MTDPTKPPPESVEALDAGALEAAYYAHETASWANDPGNGWKTRAAIRAYLLAAPVGPSAAWDRGTTHAEGCWSWGPRHYACAEAEIARLTAQEAAPTVGVEEISPQPRQ